jgi:hypothetical protein
VCVLSTEAISGMDLLSDHIQEAGKDKAAVSTGGGGGSLCSLRPPTGNTSLGFVLRSPGFPGDPLQPALRLLQT